MKEYTKVHPESLSPPPTHKRANNGIPVAASFSMPVASMQSQIKSVAWGTSNSPANSARISYAHEEIDVSPSATTRKGRGRKRARPKVSTTAESDDDTGSGSESSSEDSVNFGGMTAAAAEAKRQENEREQQRVENEQYEALMSKFQSLIAKLTALKADNKTTKSELQKAQDQIKELKAKIETMAEEQEDLEDALNQMSLTAAPDVALGLRTRGAGTKRNVEEEDRRRRAAAKNVMLAGAKVQEDDIVFNTDNWKVSTFADILNTARRWVARRAPFAQDLRTVQARYGSSVASYFMFYRWLVSCYILLSIPSVLWLIVHCARLDNSGTFSYGLNGVIPTFMAYSSFTQWERIPYISVLVLGMFLQVGMVFIKWLSEEKMRRLLDLVDEDQRHIQFSKAVLGCWDNNFTQAREVEDHKSSNGMQLLVLLTEIKQRSSTANRTLRDEIELYARRFVGMSSYIALQLFAWYTIIWLTSRSKSLSDELKILLSNTILHGLANNLAVSIVPVTVTVINTLMPIVIKAITNMEKWDSAKTITYMLTTRMYLAKILNAVIQAVSFMLLANPYLLASSTYGDIRSSVEQGFDNSSYSCRVDQASSGLFQLVVTEFVASKIIQAGSLSAMKQLSSIRRKVVVKPEFEVAKSMVSLLYFQALILACFPLFPMSPIFVTMFMVVSFKLEKKILMRYQSKPKKPWRAQDAGAFFVKFYFATYLLVGATMTVITLTTTTFPKYCSIQDETAALCEDTIDTTTDTCTPLNPDSQYYTWFNNADTCNIDGVQAYPACVCGADLACGAFVGELSAWAAADSQIRSYRWVGSVYSVIVDYPIIMWCFSAALLFLYRFQRNALKAQALATAEKERVWTRDLAASAAKIRKQAKNIENLEQQLRQD